MLSVMFRSVPMVSACSVSAKKGIPEMYVCPMSAKEATFNLYVHLELAKEAILYPSAHATQLFSPVSVGSFQPFGSS